MKVRSGVEFDVRTELRALLESRIRLAPSLSSVSTLPQLCVCLMHSGLRDQACLIAKCSLRAGDAARVLSLRALGRADDAAREAGLAQSRITLFANGLDEADRPAFLAAPATATTLAL